MSDSGSHGASVPGTRIGGPGWGILALTLGATVCVAVLAWPDHVYDRAPVRQTQTLLTITSFLRDGFAFAYETPIFSYPWRVPLEFPLYQAVAASISLTTTVRAAYAAQATTLLFYALTLMVTWRILGQLGVPRSSRAITVGLIAASPIYLFWSQTITIESAALFLSVAYLDCLIRYGRTRQARWLLLTALAGSLAGAVKLTTFAVWAFVALGALALQIVRDPGKTRKDYGPIVAALALAFVVPAVATAAWTRFADAVKAENGAAIVWVSSNWHSYALGTLQQKLSLSTWKTLLVGRPLQLMGSPLPFLAIPLALVRGRRWRTHIALCLAAYVTAYGVFTNLNVIHDYYSYANGILLVVAVGLSIDSLLSLGGWEAAFTRWTVIPGTLLLMYVFFLTMFFPAYAFARDFPVAELELVRESTSPDDALALAQGPNSELASGADRRVALATPESLRAPEHLYAAIGPSPLGAIGLCGESVKDAALVDWVVDTYALLPLALPVYPDCAIFVKASNGSLLESAARSIRERARVVSPLGHGEQVDGADGVVTVSSGRLLTFWGAARYPCPVTKGQRVRVLLRSETTTLAFPTDRVNSDPGERFRFGMMRAYDRWYDGTVDTSVTLRLSPYVLGPERYQVGLEVSAPPACAIAPVAVVWTEQRVSGAAVPAARQEHD